MIRRALLLVVAALVAAGCSGDDGDDRAAPTTATTDAASADTSASAYTSDVYADDGAWLCRPDVEDECEADLDATVIDVDGTVTDEAFAPASDPAIDCFYVYPTVSLDPESNSDMVAGNEERSVVRGQAARLGEVCAVYAPIYRQATLRALSSGGYFAARDEAYDDVLDAWRHYVAHDNGGRGVIIVGHSQGAMHLGRLLAEEIVPDAPQRELLVSAMLIGATQHASDFPDVPPCTTDGQTGCVISYASYRSTAPPPANSFFARPGDNGEQAICTNPAALAGGPAPLHPYFEGGEWGIDATAPFVAVPGLVTGECRDVDGFHHLALTLVPDGPRVDDIGGDLSPEWGMHRVDVHVAMGDLVSVARNQAEGYAG